MAGSGPRPSAGSSFPKYGDVYETDLDPVIGAETAKRRPALIVSNDQNNQFAATVTIVPLTGRPATRVHPFEALVPKGAAGLPRDSRVKANQVRTVDKSRLVRRLGTLPAQYLPQAQAALRVHLNLR